MKKDEILKIAERIENLVMVSPELKSFKSKVGGLGDVAEELSQEISNLGIKTTVVSLLYKRARYDVKQNNTTVKCIKDIDYSDIPIQDTGKTIKIEVADEKIKAQIKTSNIGKATVIFLENEIYADIVYSGDLLRQAIFIGRGTLEALKMMNIRPTIIHLHDGLTGLVSFLRTDNNYSEDVFLNQAKLVFTVHNAGIGYQQIFDSNRFEELGIDRIHWDGIVWQDKINLTYAGLFHSQRCNTVSEDYANSIKNNNENLGPVLRKKEIFGIKNGLNPDYWQVKKPKDEAKRDLIRTIKERTGKELDEKKLTIVIPRRITFQKGFDILIKLLKDIVKERKSGGIEAQVILLGRAHENDIIGKEWVKEFERLNEELKNGFVFIEGFDLELAKVMYWGGDLGFYPSVPDKEPCGTGYMVALVNQVPTIATDTGGVVDTIKEFDLKTMKGNGFKVSKKDYSPQAFWVKLKTASEIYYNYPEKWRQLMKNCLKTDVSMTKVAKEYILKLYKPILETNQN